MFTLDTTIDDLQPSQVFAREGDIAFNSGHHEQAALLYETALQHHRSELNFERQMTIMRRLIEDRAELYKRCVLVCPEAIKGYEDLWLHANAENYKSLPRHTHDENGNEIPEPFLMDRLPDDN